MYFILIVPAPIIIIKTITITITITITNAAEDYSILKGITMMIIVLLMKACIRIKSGQ